MASSPMDIDGSSYYGSSPTVQRTPCPPPRVSLPVAPATTTTITSALKRSFSDFQSEDIPAEPAAGGFPVKANPSWFVGSRPAHLTPFRRVSVQQPRKSAAIRAASPPKKPAEQAGEREGEVRRRIGGMYTTLWARMWAMLTAGWKAQSGPHPSVQEEIVAVETDGSGAKRRAVGAQPSTSLLSRPTTGFGFSADGSLSTHTTSFAPTLPPPLAPVSVIASLPGQFPGSGLCHSPFYHRDSTAPSQQRAQRTELPAPSQPQRQQTPYRPRQQLLQLTAPSRPEQPLFHPAQDPSQPQEPSPSILYKDSPLRIMKPAHKTKMPGQSCLCTRKAYRVHKAKTVTWTPPKMPALIAAHADLINDRDTRADLPSQPQPHHHQSPLTTTTTDSHSSQPAVTPTPAPSERFSIRSMLSAMQPSLLRRTASSSLTNQSQAPAAIHPATSDRPSTTSTLRSLLSSMQPSFLRQYTGSSQPTQPHIAVITMSAPSDSIPIAARDTASSSSSAQPSILQQNDRPSHIAQPQTLPSSFLAFSAQQPSTSHQAAGPIHFKDLPGASARDIASSSLQLMSLHPNARFSRSNRSALSSVQPPTQYGPTRIFVRRPQTAASAPAAPLGKQAPLYTRSLSSGLLPTEPLPPHTTMSEADWVLPPRQKQRSITQDEKMKLAIHALNSRHSENQSPPRIFTQPEKVQEITAASQSDGLLPTPSPIEPDVATLGLESMQLDHAPTNPAARDMPQSARPATASASQPDKRSDMVTPPDSRPGTSESNPPPPTIPEFSPRPVDVATLAAYQARKTAPNPALQDRDAQIDNLVIRARQAVTDSPEQAQLRRSMRMSKAAKEKEAREALLKAKKEAEEADQLARKAKKQAAKDAKRAAEEAAQQAQPSQAQAAASAVLPAQPTGPRKLIRPLTREWSAKLDLAMKQPNKAATLGTDADGINITRADFGTALPQDKAGDSPSAWLNDEIVNGFFSHICAHKAAEVGWAKPVGRRAAANPPPVVAYNSGWFSTYRTAGSDIASISRWSRRKHISGPALLGAEHIFFPVNTGSHWTLIVISPVARQILYLNSIPGDNGAPWFGLAREWLEMELGEKYVADEWTDRDQVLSQPQGNGSDCGVFTVFNGLAVALGRDVSEVVSRDMPNARRMMCAVLMNGGFTGDFAL